VRPKLLIWRIFAGFCAAFLLTACVLGVAGTNEKGINAALAATGRISFVMFLAHLLPGALVTLFGPRFQRIRRNGRKRACWRATQRVSFRSASVTRAGPTPGVTHKWRT
jgi:peptidoglycan/LPS O-acetylase OafA/YrhL